MSAGYMYIVECSDGSYYTGSTKDLDLRMQQHQAGEGANHTKKRLPVKLVYFEEFQRIDHAFNREKQVQGWSRNKKEALINGDFGKLSHLAKNYTQHPRSTSDSGLSSSSAGSDSEINSDFEGRSHGVDETMLMCGSSTSSDPEKVVEPNTVVELAAVVELAETTFNKIPENWIETTLGNSINLIGGGTPKTSIEEYWNGEIPWLSVVDFNNDNRWVVKTEKSITELGLAKSSTKLLNKGDIIISARGTVGALAQLKSPMTFNQSCYGVREKENVTDKNFLFYLLKHSIQQINRNVHGAVFDTITKQTFDFIKINLPPLPEQKAIANILTAFDDKIELLQQQNTTLETIAQTIFKEWFDNYQIGDELPDGWQVGKLGDEFEILMGQSPKGSSYNDNGEGTIFFQGRTDFKERFPSIRQFTTEPNRIADKFDVLVSVRAPVGDINVASERCCIGRGLSAVKSDNKSYALYKLLHLKPIFELFETEGTVFGSINKNSFSNIEVIIPPNRNIAEFETLVNVIDLKIFNNYQQIQSLTKTRDTLLPKLMSGQVRVKM